MHGSRQHRLRRPHRTPRLIPTGPPSNLAPDPADDLRFIRDTMERSASFTAVPGWGQVILGLTALAAAWLAAHQSNSSAWLKVWLAEGVLAAIIAYISMRS